MINNAGATTDVYSKKENIETTMMVNHVAVVYLTALLSNHINAEGKVINLSSEVYKLVKQAQIDAISSSGNEENFNGNTIYCLSKLGNIYHAMHLDQYFKKMGKRVKTASVHPGLVSSEFLNRYQNVLMKTISLILTPIKFIFFKDSKMGAQTTLHVAYLDYNDIPSGAFFNHCKVEELTNIGQNLQNVTKFMQHTKDLITKNVRDVPEVVQIYFGV